MRRFLTIALLAAPLVFTPGASGQRMGTPPAVPFFGGSTFTPGFAQPTVTPGFAQPIGVSPGMTSAGPAGFDGGRGLSVRGSTGFRRNPRFHVGLVGSSFPHFHHRHFVPAFVPFYPYVPYTQQVIYQPVVATSDEEDRYAGEDREPDREPARPLVIELHGNRYERHYLEDKDADFYGNDYADSREWARHRRHAGRGEKERAAERAEEAETAKPVERPPTVLIFRNGSRLEVHDYAVVGGTLFEFSEDRTHAVLISELDLPATLRENRERGLDLHLPAASSMNPGVRRP